MIAASPCTRLVRTSPRPAYTGRHAVTLIETVVVIVIITALAGVILGGVSFAVRSARKSGEQEMLRTLTLAVEKFKEQFAVLPPIINDLDPLDAQGRLNVRDGEFLRGETDAGEARFSYFSVPIFLAGQRDKDIDGIDGAGMTAWDPNAAPAGRFSNRGGKVDSYLDMGKMADRLVPVRAPPLAGGSEWEGKFGLGDRWKTPVRYFRWEPRFTNGIIADAALFVPTEIQLLTAPGREDWKGQENLFRDSRFALQSAGPDGKFNGTPGEEDRRDDDLWEFGR